jgi:glycosyltransferase involved in cell wall biosynthesis
VAVHWAMMGPVTTADPPTDAVPPPSCADVLVVVPAFNEEATVGEVVGALRAHGFAVAVVSDGSRDRTAERAEAAGATVLRLPMNLGVGAALRCGFRYAVEHGFEIAVQCDADGQHPPELVAHLLAQMAAVDADLVVGSRFASGGTGYRVGRSRRSAMHLLSSLARRGGGIEVLDTTSGFRAIRRPLLDEFAAKYPSQYLGDTFEVLVASGRAGYRVVEVPVEMRERTAGESSARGGVALRYLIRAVLAVVLRTGVRFAPVAGRSRGGSGAGRDTGGPSPPARRDVPDELRG